MVQNEVQTQMMQAVKTQTATRQATVLMCDTQPLAVEGVRGILAQSAGLRFAGSVSSLSAATELSRALNPSAVLVDKSFGIQGILDWLQERNQSGAPAPVIVWGAGISEQEGLRLLQGGAKGVLRRTAEADTVLHCIRSVVDGDTWVEPGIFGGVVEAGYGRRSPLTPRETEIARLVEQGLRNRDIAQTLGIQTGTVKIHLKHIFEKTGVRGRYGLALNSLREKGTLAFTTAANAAPEAAMRATA